jgi:hypothetical protein
MPIHAMDVSGWQATPRLAQDFRLVNCYNLPIYKYCTYVYIYTYIYTYCLYIPW